MPDDLQIPIMSGPARAPISSSYRPRRVAAPGMRGMAIAAAAIGGVLVLGLGGWALMGRHPAAVPVIEADSRPLRVKPENPGGMQVAGADEQVLGGSGGGADRMAPAPEAPAPQALRAQMQPAPAAGAESAAMQAPPGPGPALGTGPAGGAAAVGPGAMGPSAVGPASNAAAAGAAVPASSPLPDTPARPAPAARTAPPAHTPAAGGATMVQLAAVETEASAQSEWQRLARRMPELLGERRPVLQRTEREGRTLWRVRTGGFSDTADATGFCAKVKAKGAACTVASF